MSATNENKQGLLVLGSRVFGSVVEVPGDMVSPDVWKKVVLYQFIYSMTGLFIGLACILMGLVLIGHGVVNDGHWTADFFGIRLSDASPGIVLFFIGLMLPRLTAFDVRFAKPTPPPAPPAAWRSA
jgi:hypothetical protein